MSDMPRSQALYARACKVMPGGNTRTTVFMRPHPCYAAYGKGCRLTDVEGVERVDFTNNYNSLIHGHAHPAINEAVRAQIELGSAFPMATELEIRLAAPPCPAKSSRPPRPALSVTSDGQKVVRAESVQLEVTGTDACGNAATATYDPAAEPSPLCDEVLDDGTCCPPIGPPPGTACTLPPCAESLGARRETP